MFTILYKRFLWNVCACIEWIEIAMKLTITHLDCSTKQSNCLLHCSDAMTYAPTNDSLLCLTTSVSTPIWCRYDVEHCWTYRCMVVGRVAGSVPSPVALCDWISSFEAVVVSSPASLLAASYAVECQNESLAEWLSSYWTGHHNGNRANDLWPIFLDLSVWAVVIEVEAIQVVPAVPFAADHFPSHWTVTQIDWCEFWYFLFNHMKKVYLCFQRIFLIQEHRDRFTWEWR